MGTVELVEKYDKPMVFVNQCCGDEGTTNRPSCCGPEPIWHSGTNYCYITALDFAASMIDGRVAREINGTSRSAEEITSLWNYVTTRIRKVKKDGIKPQGSILFCQALKRKGSPLPLQ